MSRGKRILIERDEKDNIISSYKEIDTDKMLDEYERKINSISSSFSSAYNEAQKIYKQKKIDDEMLEKKGLYTVQNAYDFLRQNKFDISSRAFGGRIERGTIPTVKIGKKRYILLDALNNILDLKTNYCSIREAYELYKQSNPTINFRAFIGRIEKKSIPSVKFGTKRLIPRKAIDALMHVAEKYYSVTQAIKKLYKENIKIKRNAFERRLDRKRIPHVKIAGRRYMPIDVIDELIEKELALREKK